MTLTKSSAWQRGVFFALVVSLAWILASVAASADIRIEIEDEGFTQQIWLKDSLILIAQPDMHILFDCKAENFALLVPQPKRYWQGTLKEFRDELNAIFAALAGSDQPIDLFSTAELPPVNVRTTRVGTERIAGYDTLHYKVEFEVDGTWHLFEEVWTAPLLLQEIEAETSKCLNTQVRNFMLSLVQLQVGGWLSADPTLSVLTSPEYIALSKEGFIVRNLSVIEMYEFRIEALSEVKEVSKDPLDEALFVIPEDYQSMTLLEAIR